MVQLKNSYLELFKTTQFPSLNLHIESTVKELPLYDFQIDDSSPGKEVAQAFQANLLLPAARRSLQRPNHLVYEPIVVEIEPSVFRLLAMQQLLLNETSVIEL